MINNFLTRKVININCQTISFSGNKENILDSFASRMAINLKKYSSLYKSECWFAVDNINEEKKWSKNGITYRLFPSITLSKMAESFFGLVFSKSLEKALIKEKQKNGNIYHIQGERGLLVWKIINTVKGKPIIIQFHGYRGIWFLRFFEKWIIEVGERRLFKYVNYFLVHFKTRVNYLINYCNISKKQILFQNLGVDYEMFKPMNKGKLREELGLPKDKKIIIYVGGGVKTKGVEKIIKAHKIIKNEYNTFLLLIGVLKDHPLYEECKINADLVLERLPHQIMPKYFNAADVCCMICPKDKQKYGGIGIAAMEAMACGVPIINSNIDDSPDNIKNQVGLKATNEVELINGLIKIFEKKIKFGNINNITEKYFSWKAIIKNILKIYNSFDLGKI